MCKSITGEAVPVSAANRTGPFDVLAGHINFFSLLTGGTIVLNNRLPTAGVPSLTGHHLRK